MLPMPNALQNETGFFFLTIDKPSYVESYEEYRQFRVINLEGYGLGFLKRSPYLKRIIGIATEPPGGGRGSSEDMLFIEPGEWSSEFEDRATELAADLGILNIDTLKLRALNSLEFPREPVESAESFHKSKLSKRQQRRKRRR